MAGGFFSNVLFKLTQCVKIVARDKCVNARLRKLSLDGVWCLLCRFLTHTFKGRLNTDTSPQNFWTTFLDNDLTEKFKKSAVASAIAISLPLCFSCFVPLRRFQENLTKPLYFYLSRTCDSPDGTPSVISLALTIFPLVLAIRDKSPRAPLPATALLKKRGGGSCDPTVTSMLISFYWPRNDFNIDESLHFLIRKRMVQGKPGLVVTRGKLSQQLYWENNLLERSTRDRVLHYLPRQVKFDSLSCHVIEIKRLFQRNKLLYYLERCPFTEYVG